MKKPCLNGLKIEAGFPHFLHSIAWGFADY